MARSTLATESPAQRVASTAATLILVGLILQGIEVGVLLLVGLFFLIVPFLGAVILGLALLGVLWLVLVYVFSYQRVREGDYLGARTPTLVFAILSLISIGLISGILYLIAWVSLGDAARASQSPQMPWGSAPVAPTGSAWGPRCARCGNANPVSSRFCSSCGSPLPGA